MLELRNINTHVGDFSLKDVNLKVEKGDYYILLGVSGAGKSLILETIAGLINTRSGSIILDGDDITHEKIQKRSIGIVFQDHAVFPHMSVYQNIAYSLHGRKLSPEQKSTRIRSIAAQMNISSLLQRQPSTLSGGELQRVALARTLVQEPKVLLLDEPLASMDVELKRELRSLLRQINRTGQTIIHVSHSYEEAVSLGNKIAVINNGSVLQQGITEDVLNNPVSRFVAHFTGARNFYPVKLRSDNDKHEYILGERISIHIHQTNLSSRGCILLRSEDIYLTPSKINESGTNSIEGEIKELVKLPGATDVLIDASVPVYVVLNQHEIDNLKLREGSKVFVNFNSKDVRFLPAND